MKFFWKDAEEYSSMPPMQKTEKERRNHATVDRTPRRPGLYHRFPDRMLMLH